MRFRTIAVSFAAFAVIAVIAPTPAAAIINALTNGFFDTTLNGWTHLSAQVDVGWSSADANNSSSSGSAGLRDVDPSASASNLYWTALGQCVPATAGNTYHLSAETGIPSGQSTTGRLTVVISYYSGASCGGSQKGNSVFSPANHSADNTWHLIGSDSVAPAGTQSAWITLDIQKDQAGGAFVGFFDDVFLWSGVITSSCTADATHLCLTGNRFRVSMQWTNYNTNVTKAANAVPFAGETGFFYFDDPNNLELMVKVHNACNGYSHYWVFAAATTNVGYTLTVTDTLTGETHQYYNTPHVLSPAITDQGNFGSSSCFPASTAP